MYAEDLRDPAKLLRILANPLCGVIKSVQAESIPPGLPPISVFRASLARPVATGIERERVSSYMPQFSSGVGATIDTALWTLIGEAVERYSASTYDTIDLIEASQKELGAHAMSLGQWIGVDENPDRERYKYERLDPQRKIFWTGCTSLIGSYNVYVPASFVWLSVSALIPDQRMIPTVSTGLAAGQNLQDAICSGLQEVIERDAFMCHWLLGKAPVRLNITQDLISELPMAVRRIVNSDVLRVDIFDIGTEFDVECVMCRIRLNGSNNSSLGASARLDFATAVGKAVLEAYHVFLGALRHSQLPKSSSISRTEIKDFMGHGMHFYHNPDLYEAFFDGPVRDPVKKVYRKAEGDDTKRCHLVNELIERIAVCGYHPYYSDITPDDVADLGLHVVRCLIPGLQPLAAGHYTLAHDTRRLRRLCDCKGWTSPEKLNLDPHPFA